MIRLLKTVLVLTVLSVPVSARTLVVGSKNFNESYILGEIVAQALEHAGFTVERRFGLGGTLICYQALINKQIDVYVEYTGTLSQAILHLDSQPAVAGLNRLLKARGLLLLNPFGFNNTYALAMKRSLAQAKGIATLSDLVGHRELKVAVSHEFLRRRDGWPGLMSTYGFDWIPGGIDHGLAYQALNDGAVDVTDVYTTDGELTRGDLLILHDDKHFFPQYLAAPLVRRDLPPRAIEALQRLGGTLDDQAMRSLNAGVLFRHSSFAQAAASFLSGHGMKSDTARGRLFWHRLLKRTATHLKLTGIALGLAMLAGIGLAVLVYNKRGLSRAVVYTAGLMQTIPSIALLALMIPLFGIGQLPAIVALFLYSVLPILRNAVTALATIDPLLKRVAMAIGLSPREQLRLIYLPLSLPGIMAGVRTAAVISIGTATLAAFVGAGGLGEPIVTGLALNDPRLILEGAVPAAMLAILTELLFEFIERRLIPAHLRQAAVGH